MIKISSSIGQWAESDNIHACFHFKHSTVIAKCLSSNKDVQVVQDKQQPHVTRKKDKERQKEVLEYSKQFHTTMSQIALLNPVLHWR